MNSSLGERQERFTEEVTVIPVVVKALKQVPPPIRWLLHPMGLLSLALHGVLIFLPIASSEKDAQETATEPISIQITAMPEVPDRQLDAPAVLPPDLVVPPIAEPSSPSPAPVASPSQAAPPAAPQPPERSPSAASPTSPVPTPELPPPDSAPLPFANFPHLPSAAAGCFGLGNCHQVEGENFRQMGTSLVDQLVAEGYEVRSRDDLDDSGIKVYEVTRNGESQYLSLLQPDLGTSVYVLAAAPVTTADLQAAQPLQEQFHDVLSQVSREVSVQPADFSYPDFFFEGTVPRPEIGQPFYTVTDTQPDRLAVALMPELTADGFAVESFGEYAGAPFYKISQGAFVAYLSVVPRGDRTGTLLVAWNRLPD
ncbi:MAG: hypothetical protein ACFB8W_05055 [Elainellaceae cyanobacterium]